VLAGARTSDAQTLGELAQQEAERRGAITSPARVIRAYGLPRTPTLVPARAPASTPDADEARRVPVSPAIFQAGALPRIPVQAMSGGEVLIEVSVDTVGRVVDAKVLRDTPPFTQEVLSAIRGWRFEPAADADAPLPGEPVDLGTREPMDSKVLVAGLFRPPALFPVTLGQPPVDRVSPSESVPAPVTFPPMPLYRPNALFDGVVLAELQVDEEGAVSTVRILRSGASFDAPTLDVVRGLRFRPGRVHGQAAPARVYVVAAFRQPIIQ
jgi:TonB family protein